ncbi:fumarylacetoacetate hydrolase family protein [Chryseolinea sp. H1M3-3]|uniref:fumarylacetoacetate hydrolase family protein n=1 Tax=Chryseolinea sp. H1M3-3 TaxID=3034144 RepID=UPI0023EAED24|nr:fumarylacetoacetate hydrolase family protein [Chryseolinea sp. H1M3-3]
MRVYKTKRGIVVEKEKSLFLLENQNWDTFINDDNLSEKLEKITKDTKPSTESQDSLLKEVQAPIQNQEVWASGVTYLRSKVGRQEESKNAGGSDFYARVYEAERPELFFKATPARVVPPGGNVRIRKDSTWDVPEPELTLVITSKGKIVGYTIGNDMSSRSIEGENPLYLPQAKTYDGCAALGPCIYVTQQPLAENTIIQLEISRDNTKVFEGTIGINQIKRKFTELVEFLYREASFPNGSFLMTGTGIVPGNDFTLQKNDEIKITIEPIGTLVNKVG